MEAYATVIDPNYDIEWVLDSMQHAGPVDAIIENLNDPFALKEEFVQLATIDVPWINAEVFSSLKKSISDNDFLIMPTDGEKIHPLMALVRPQQLHSEIKKWNGEPLREFFLSLPNSLLFVSPRLIKNINYAEDL
jgi:molybdopterin-guanine dinucleotide biosynthesis protein A